MKHLHSPKFPCNLLGILNSSFNLNDLDPRKNIEAVKFSEGWGIFNGRKRYWASDFEKEEIAKEYPGLRTFERKTKGHTWYASSPIDLEIEVTKRCNERCIHCFNDCDTQGEEMDPEELKKTIREFRKGGGQRVLFTGGEPLIYPSLQEIVEFSKSEGIQEYSMITNGSMVTLETADFLSKNFEYINISVHGDTAEVHDRVTCSPGSFDRLTRGIQLLRERGVDILVYFTLMEENFESLPGMFDFIKERDCEGIRIKALNPDGRAKSRKQITREGKALVSEYINALSKVKDVKVIDSELHRGKTYGRVPPKFSGCEALRTIIYISSNGDIHSCNLMYEETLGNLKKESLGDFWMSDVAVKYRDKISGREIDCNNCGGLCRRNEGGLVEKCT